MPAASFLSRSHILALPPRRMRTPLVSPSFPAMLPGQSNRGGTFRGGTALQQPSGSPLRPFPRRHGPTIAFGCSSSHV